MNQMKIKILPFAFLMMATALNAQPIFDRGSTFHPLRVPASEGMVVAQDRLAAEVGAKILDSGGNAVDAAVATGFALAVTFPQAGNLGGGGFMLIYLADTQETVAIDYREVAPSLSSADMFLDDSGKPDPRLSRSSALSSGVPGTVAGLIDAQEMYGELSLSEVMQPAIELARSGITVSDSLAWSLAQARNKFLAFPSSVKYFLDENLQTPQAGDLWVQSDLANTLEAIASQGKVGFYAGDTAAKIVAESARHGGLISMDDLAGYQTVLRYPVTGAYGEYEIVSMPPPSSGGVHLIQILKILEELDIGQFEHNSAAYLHRLVESMKYAYADRSLYLGDPDFVEVPVAKLLNDSYLQNIASNIYPNRATPSSQIAPDQDLLFEGNETTHFSTWDGQGNVVSNTYTLNFSYGNGIAVEGAGFLLNNEMDDFTSLVGASNGYGLIGGRANSIAPGKRPLSSMTPTIVLQDGKPIIVTGSPGGSSIISIVAQVLLNMLEFEMNPTEAVSVPRIHHQWQPDSIRWQPGISADTRAVMEAMGHTFDANSRVWGKAETISFSDGYLNSGVDPRWPGSGAASQ
jgi:gamma-glutamyltranspeptidase/glutathione hydrolase